MTVFLKGYDVPKSCSECYIEDCSLCFDRCGVAENGGIHGDCPIIQMPPHGDLIDKGKLVNVFFDLLDDSDKPVHDMLLEAETAPTIIESEEE